MARAGRRAQLRFIKILLPFSDFICGSTVAGCSLSTDEYPVPIRHTALFFEHGLQIRRWVAGSGCAPGAPMVRTIKHTKFSGCRCIRYAARSTGRGLNNIFRNWRVGMSPHLPPGAQRLSNQEGPKSVTVSRFLSAFFYVKSPVRFSF